MEIGELWKGWTVDSFLGKGSFGKVYKISKTEYGHTYTAALKVISIPQDDSEVAVIASTGMDVEGITSFFREKVQDIISEISLMSELKGISNIVSYEDHEVVEKTNGIGWDIYIRMELLTPLNTHFSKKDLTVNDVIKLGMDICDALTVCQKYNIIHRDIKPENIFYSNLGFYKLGDFGIAKQLELTTASLSQKGTPSYMAPEVYKGLSYTSNVDIYSLGIVLYQFLNNKRLPFYPPYPDPIKYSDSERAKVKRLSGDAIPAPCNANGRLGEIILKACSYDPKDRYESPEEMKAALAALSYTENERPLIYPGGDIISNVTTGKVTYDIFEDPTVDMEDTKDLQDDPTLDYIEATDAEPLISYEDDKQDNNPINTVTSDADSGSNDIEQKPNSLKKIMACVAIFAGIGFGLFKFLFVTVPDVVGMDAATAQSKFESAGIEFNETREFSKKVEKDIVISQSNEKQLIRRGSTIDVVVSRGKAISAPDLKGKTEKNATSIAKKVGLKVVVGSKNYSDSIPKGSVIKQSPKAGKKCEEGQEITLVISKGIEQVKVPNVVGKTAEKAQSTLKEAKLKTDIVYSYSNSIEEGNVISQSVAKDKKIDKNSTITITVSSGPAPRASSGNGSKSKSKKKKSGEAVWS